MKLNGLSVCELATGEDLVWTKLYENSFPPEERAPLENITAGLIAGNRQLHQTKANKEVLCFSLIYKFDTFVWLSYIATQSEFRSQGIGGMHLRKLIERLDPSAALLLEIESPSQKGLGQAEISIRKRRLDFYLNLGAQRMREGMFYLMPNFIPHALALPGELLWFKPIDLALAIPQIYDKIYGLNPDDPIISEVMKQFS